MPLADSDSAEYRVAGVVLLRPDGSALLQLRDNKPGLSSAGLWVFPGGHCETTEAIELCASREFREETGYACGGLRYLISLVHRADTGRTYFLNFFWDLYDGVQPVACFEGQEIRFVARQGIENYPIPDYVPDVWDRALGAAGLTPV